MQDLFAVLGLPQSFELNLKKLETAYFEAQRASHPDRFVGKSEAERVDAASKSMLVNEAYDVLKNPLTRAEHLLDLNGIVTDEASPEVLMEMMELREAIHDSAGDGRALLAQVDEVKAHANDCNKALTEAFEKKDYAAASEEAIRLSYLGKAMEEAHMLLYQYKANHG